MIGFSTAIDKGEWTGFDVDFCRALAAAIFNDAGKVKFVAARQPDRPFPGAAIRANIDVLSRNSTWTMSRETELSLIFAA